MVEPEFAALAARLLPEAADLNGSSWVQEEPEVLFELNGNGLLDCVHELALVEKVFNTPFFKLPNGLKRSTIIEGWNKNYAQLAADVGMYWPLIVLLGDGLPQLMVGMMLIGDGSSDYSIPGYVSCTGSAGFIQALMFLLGDTAANPQIDLNNYARFPQYFSKYGDADGDGFTNAAEFAAFGPDPVSYVAAALDPTIVPPAKTANAAGESRE